MKYGELLALLIFFIMIIDFTGNAQPNTLASDDKIKVISKKVKKIVKDFEIENQNAEVSYDHENNNVEYKIKALVSMLGAKRIPMEALIGTNNEFYQITAYFPRGASNKFKIAGKKVNKWIPQIFENRLDLKKVELSLSPHYIKKKNMTLFSLLIKKTKDPLNIKIVK